MDKKNSEERRLSSGRHRKNIRKDVRKFASFGFMQKKLTQKKWRIFLVFRQYIVVHDTKKKVLEVGMELVANVTNGIWCVEYFWTQLLFEYKNWQLVKNVAINVG